jgi:hypothetical protein
MFYKLNVFNKHYIISFLEEDIILKSIDDLEIFLFSFKEKRNIWHFKINQLSGIFKLISSEKGIYFQNNESYFIDLKSGKLIDYNKKYYLFISNDVEVSINMEYPSLINISRHNRIIISLPYQKGFKFFCEDIFLQQKQNEISCYSLSNGKDVWQLDFGDLGSYTDDFSKQEVSGRVEELIVVDNSILVASVHRYGILGISLQTGAILWQVPNIQNVVLNERILYSFSDAYFEIDAISGQVLRQEDYKTLFKANEFRTYWLTKPAISENLIAIASHYDNALLLLNRDSFSIIQRLELGKASNGIPLTNTPQIHQNRLYQLDGDNTLHIFGQEV